jgi:colanic acid/amylovoran biosynthesis glycosyltransferase
LHVVKLLEVDMSKKVNKSDSVGHIMPIYLLLTENWIYDQIRFQTSYSSIILAGRLVNEDRFPHDRVYALPNWPRIIKRGMRKLFGHHYWLYHLRVARNQRVSLLHAHFGEAGLHSLPLCRALGVPLITSFYGYDMTRRLGRGDSLERRYAPLFERGDLFLVEGPAAKEQLASIGCPGEKIRIQRLGVDLEQIPYQARRVSGAAPIRILMAATFAEKKGMPYGVEAFCQAAQGNARLRLTVVGDAPPAPWATEGQQLKRQLRNLVDQYGMRERVSFLGYVSIERLRRLSYEHHIFLHPSVTASTGDKEGGSPVVITQMAASGLPVVATRHCDIPQVVPDGETGLLADERNVEQLRVFLLRLATDDRLRAQMGRRGRDHVAERFCVRRQGLKLGEIYSELLAN